MNVSPERRVFYISMWGFYRLDDCFRWLLTGNVPRQIAIQVELPSNPKKYKRLMKDKGARRLISFLAKHFPSRDIFIRAIPEFDEDQYVYYAKKYSNIKLVDVGFRSKHRLVKLLKPTRKKIFDGETALDTVICQACCREEPRWQTDEMANELANSVAHKHVSLDEETALEKLIRGSCKPGSGEHEWEAEDVLTAFASNLSDKSDDLEKLWHEQD